MKYQTLKALPVPSSQAKFVRSTPQLFSCEKSRGVDLSTLACEESRFRNFDLTFNHMEASSFPIESKNLIFQGVNTILRSGMQILHGLTVK